MNYMTKEEFEQLKPGDIVQIQNNQQPSWLNNEIVEIISIENNYTIKVVYLNVKPSETNWGFIAKTKDGFEKRHQGKLWSNLSINCLRPRCKRLTIQYGQE